MPINGDIIDRRETFYVGDTVEFECDYGYDMAGKSNWTCQENGQWDESCVTCEREGKRLSCKQSS